MTKPLLVGNKSPVASPEDATDIREPQLTKNIELGLVRSLNSLSSFVLFLFNSLTRILILSHLSLTLSRILPLSHSFSKLLLPKKRLIGELEGSNYCRGGGRIKFFLLKRSKQKREENLSFFEKPPLTRSAVISTLSSFLRLVLGFVREAIRKLGTK